MGGRLGQEAGRRRVNEPSIWEILGIDPTDDLGAIRRAYTIQLKALDIDAEPRRFAALRAAYDSARAESRDAPRRAPVDHAEPLEDPHGLAASSSTSIPPSGADRAEIERLKQSILALLRGATDVSLIEGELADLTLELLAEIDRETLDHQVAGEEWFVATIAWYLPRSDAMVRPAVASFRWQDRRHGQYRPDRAMVVVDRMRDLTYADQQVLREQAIERQHNDEFNQMLATYGTGWLPRIVFAICMLMIAGAFGSVLLLLT